VSTIINIVTKKTKQKYDWVPRKWDGLSSPALYSLRTRRKCGIIQYNTIQWRICTQKL